MLKMITKTRREKEITTALHEAMTLIDSLLEHDIGFKSLFKETVNFYNVDAEDLKDRLTLYLSEYDFHNNEIDFEELKSMTGLSAISLSVPQDDDIRFDLIDSDEAFITKEENVFIPLKTLLN